MHCPTALAGRSAAIAAVLVSLAACAGWPASAPTSAAAPARDAPAGAPAAPAPTATGTEPITVPPSPGAAAEHLDPAAAAPDAPAAAVPAPAPAAKAPPIFAGKRPSRAEAAAAFERAGVQPGQPLPELSLVDLDGAPADLARLAKGRPLLLVTCSLTCNIARQQQAAVAALRARLGDRALVAMIYTIDAHPKGDPSPYTGEEWVTPGNDRDRALVRQPATLAERLVLARRYAAEWATDTTVLVDTMDDASWRALGMAPNVGLAVGADGTVLARSGWFDAARLEQALAR